MTNRIALLLTRKYEIDFARISRKNTKKINYHYKWLDWWRDSIWATSAEIYLSGVYYGAPDFNVVFALNYFLSADNSKSRRCLELTLKVVVVKYVVEL
jgi:hypothetical protein